MKTSILGTAASVLLSLSLPSLAQIVTETKTSATTTAGTVTSLEPNVLIVRSESSAHPVRYTYTKTTKYVDAAGSPVSVEIVKSGAPVTVHYIKQGDQMIAEKVVVRRTDAASPPVGVVTETKKTTTTTTGAPIPPPVAPVVEDISTVTTSSRTVSGIDGEILSMRTEGSPAPVRYTFSKTTQYVDETGAPVTIDVVKSGAPVTIHYVTEGGRTVAQKVVVNKTTTTVR